MDSITNFNDVTTRLDSDNITLSINSTNISHQSPIFSSDDQIYQYDSRDSLFLIVPITIIYGLIFITGCIGNISTCIVISKNKSMYSATNYYLFSLAVSDFVLLISGVPMELYHIWYKNTFIFGEMFCILRNMVNEMSANATVLTITAFSIERYFAICHPFLSHTMSKLSRAVKYIFLIWILSISFAIPQALQTGLVGDVNGNSWCTIVDERVLIEHSFELATVLFFFAPMVLITVLYILIGVKLRSSTMIKRDNGSIIHRNNNLTANIHQSHSTCQSSKRVIKMLVAVVICFFVCWAPFQGQRLVYMWAIKYMDDALTRHIFVFTTYASGILYYASTCINPILYNLMSNKFRQAFKKTLHEKCCNYPESPSYSEKHEYRILSRGKRRFVQHESSEYSGSGRDDYSSSYKQSIDSMTNSRNTSLRHLKQNKVDKGLTRMDNFLSAQKRSNYVIGEYDELSAPASHHHQHVPQHQSCVSAEITNDEIRVITNKTLNEIHLNVFPPKAENEVNSMECFDEKSTRQSLSLSVHEKMYRKTRATSYVEENEKKLSNVGTFTFVSFRKSDSLLHITIGKSSKITKRRKRISWLLARLLKFSRRRANRRNQKFLHDSHATIEQQQLYDIGSSSFDNDGRLKFTNDEMTVAIAVGDDSNKSSFEIDDENIKTQSVARKLLESLNDDDIEIENGANELDLYMNEVRRREMRRQI